MPKITDIKSQQKNQHLYSVFVDGKYEFSFDQDDLLKHKIKIGAEFSEVAIDSLKSKSVDAKAYALAYKKSLSRPHSRREMFDYLRKKQLSPETIDNFLAKLEAKKLIDDQVYAEFYIRHKQVKKSNREMTAYLMNKGVDRSVIESALPSDSNAALRSLIAKKSKQTRYQDQKKLIEFLLRKGFRYADIKAELEKTGQ